MDDNLTDDIPTGLATGTGAVRNPSSFSRRHAFRIAGLTAAGAAAVAAAGTATTSRAEAAETPDKPAPECAADLLGGN